MHKIYHIPIYSTSTSATLLVIQPYNGYFRLILQRKVYNYISKINNILTIEICYIPKTPRKLLDKFTKCTINRMNSFNKIINFHVFAVLNQTVTPSAVHGPNPTAPSGGREKSLR